MENAKRLWIKYKEYILYVLFGCITAAVNYGVFVLCRYVFHMDIVTTNVLAWIFAVLAAFITNKIWVFESKSLKLKVMLKEFVQFVIARALTLVIETFLLWLFVNKFHVNDLIMKIITNIIVIILNYIFSKFIIFKKKKT